MSIISYSVVRNTKRKECEIMTLIDRLQQILSEASYENSRKKNSKCFKENFSFLNHITESLDEMDAYLEEKLHYFQYHKKR